MEKMKVKVERFNAARGFVSGAASAQDILKSNPISFNAARGFVSGAAAK